MVACPWSWSRCPGKPEGVKGPQQLRVFICRAWLLTAQWSVAGHRPVGLDWSPLTGAWLVTAQWGLTGHCPVGRGWSPPSGAWLAQLGLAGHLSGACMVTALASWCLLGGSLSGMDLLEVSSLECVSVNAEVWRHASNPCSLAVWHAKVWQISHGVAACQGEVAYQQYMRSCPLACRGLSGIARQRLAGGAACTKMHTAVVPVVEATSSKRVNTSTCCPYHVRSLARRRATK
eukprot:364670-Chlamydomonas_euryale.AAC.3